MTYLNTAYSTSTDNAAAAITAIKAALTASGWTQATNTWTKAVSGGPTLSVTISATALSSSGILAVTLGSTTSTTTRYLYAGNSTLTNSLIGVEYSIGPSHFYLRFTGPGPGLTGAFDSPKGSPSTFMLLTTYTPYFSTSNGGAAAARRWALVSSIGSSSPTASISSPPTAQYQITAPAPDTGTLENDIELLTVRPVIQDTPAVGDLIPNKTYGAGDVYWPFILDSATRGLMGRLDNVYFGGDNYSNAAGDDVSLKHTRDNVLINTYKYVRTVPAYFPNTSGVVWYTPFGICNPVPTASQGVTTAGTGLTAVNAAGGPNILIKKGDGS